MRFAFLLAPATELVGNCFPSSSPEEAPSESEKEKLDFVALLATSFEIVVRSVEARSDEEGEGGSSITTSIASVAILAKIEEIRREVADFTSFCSSSSPLRPPTFPKDKKLAKKSR